MKKVYGFALIGAMAAAPLAVPADAHAQEETIRRGHAPVAGLLQHRAELGLTAEQVQRLEAIGQDLRAQNAPLLEQLRASGAWPRGERGAMTPEQRAEMREQMRQRRTGGDRPAAGERRGMTAEQRAEMRQRMEAMTPEQRAEMRQQMAERRAGAGARGARVPEELRPVMQQLQANTRAAMEQARAVLTPEQQARMAELRAERRGAGERGQRGRGFRGGARAQ